MTSVPQSTPAPGSAEQKANRRIMLMIFAVFLVPVVVAYTAHFFGWYKDLGLANRGFLINPPIDVRELSIADKDGLPFSSEDHLKTWFLIYVPPKNCGSACDNSLYLMRQANKALGSDQQRVKRMLISWSDISEELRSKLDAEFPNMLEYQAGPELLKRALAPALQTETNAIEAGRIYIMDPWGFIMLSYPAVADEQESILKGKDLLKDLKRMLKVSRIG